MDAHQGALAAEMRESRPAGELSGFQDCQLGCDSDKDSNPANDRQLPFADQRSAALALLNGSSRLTRKAGQFLGQCAVDDTPLSEAQLDWLETLLSRAELPRLEQGARQ